MNIRQAGVVFLGSILVLLLFQALWLSNTYQLERDGMRVDVDIFLKNSIKEEIALRAADWAKNDSVEYVTGTSEDEEKCMENSLKENSNTQTVTLDVEEGLDDGLLQQILLITENYFNLSVLDSLFRQKLVEADYDFDYLICYRDSADQLLESKGITSLENKKRVFISDSIPVVNENYAHLIYDISMPTVFKQMVGSLIASSCMFFLMLLALIYQIRFIHNQYKLSKLKEDFSHALVHDLRTPLTVILSVLSSYKSGVFEDDPAFGTESTDIAIDQVLSIQTLVDRILTMAQLEDNRLPLNRTITDIPAITDKLIQKHRFADRKNINFETHYELSDIPVFADSALIENAIGNLIDNAIKYSGETVNICICEEIKDGKLYIKVKDNGFGISQKDQLTIFNKFERGAAIYRKGARGFGLGLSYVRQVATAHQGTVALYSRKGKGSEFVMVIPLLMTPYEENVNTNKNK
ncbi:MAG: HAMP domain-containing histidine kinase [Tannerellaceae bacterium]|jgi:two-component system phosphate regulon sensor histidine kinase PhoR|nr:HAMP domain-containing histidine kinase [Tannerellaceae bacterium]